MLKKIIITLLSLIILSSEVFAQSAVIYAPTEAATLKDTVDTSTSIITEESSGPSSSAIDNSIKSDESMKDFNNVYTLSEDSNGYYYVKKNNTQVKNAWRKISLKSFKNIGADTDKFNHDYIWCYCGSNGRLLKASSGKMKKYAIDGAMYAFNEYGQLLEGYFNDEGEMLDDNEEPWQLISSDNYFYYADKDSGKLFSGWLKYTGETDDYDWKGNIWFYFDPKNYRCIKSKDSYYKLTTIGDKKFAFDSNGVMLTGMDALKYKSESDETIKYFNSDGSVITNGFAVLSLEDEVVSENYSDYEDYDEDIAIYLSKNGKMYKNQIKKINNYYYGFDKKGVVLKNCIGIFKDGSYVDNISLTETDGKDFIIYGKYTNKSGTSGTLGTSVALHYFDSNGKRQLSGSIEFDDEKYTWGATSSGANEGLKSKKFYAHGLLMKPIDTKYGIFIQNPTKTSYSMSELYSLSNVYIVDKNGQKISSTSVKNDSGDYYWLTSSSGNFIGVYTCKVKNSGTKQWYSEYDSKWYDFDSKDTYSKTQENYKANNIDSDYALNFNLS